MSSSYLKKAATKTQRLKEQGFFASWHRHRMGKILFIISPTIKIDDSWFHMRTAILDTNAKTLGIKKIPLVTFYVYDSLDKGERLGIVPAVSLISKKEIHGHLQQSPGHELTHILLGEINDSNGLPANGFWAEGVSTFLDGTGTDRRKHAMTIGISLPSRVPWTRWFSQLPSANYPLAGSFVQFLVEQHGIKYLVKFLKSLRKFEAMKTVFRQVFNEDFLATQKAWLLWLKELKK